MKRERKEGVGVGEKGGGRIKAVREMPRTSVKNLVQAQEDLPVSKSSITKLVRIHQILSYKY